MRLAMTPGCFFTFMAKVVFYLLLLTLLWTAVFRTIVYVEHSESFAHQLSNNRSLSGNVITAWLFNKKGFQSFVSSVENLHKQTKIPVNMYCGTMTCVNAVERLKTL